MATRLRPLTDIMPKSMVTVDGTPFIEWQLSRLREQGIRKVIICAGYRSEQITDRVKNGKRFGLTVEYSFDGPSLQGTCGALRKALPLLGSSFGVLYGDVYPLYELPPIYEHFLKAEAYALMAVHAPGRGNVRYSSGWVMAYTPDGYFAHGDAGFSVLSRNAVAHTGATDLGDLFSWLAVEGCLDGYEVTDPVYEIGSHEGLARFRDYVVCQ